MRTFPRNAFTMMELIIVIIIMGILAALALPRMNDDRLQEAADQILSHLRYTQHLAMMDNVFDPEDSNWYKKRIQLLIYHDGSGDKHLIYTIYSDKDEDENTPPEVEEIFKDSLSQKLLIGDNNYNKHWERLDLTGQYGIDNIQVCGTNHILTTSNTGNSQHIFFDSLGRPYHLDATNKMDGIFGNLIRKPCDIVFKSGKKKFTIIIQPITGTVQVKWD